MDLFTARILLAFVIGGLWVTVATLAAERFGTKIGGLIAGLPSTALMVLFFVGWYLSAGAAVEATDLIPLAGVASVLFLLVYIWKVGKNFWLALGFAALVWSLVMLVSIMLGEMDYWQSLAVFLLVLAISFYIVERVLKISSEKPVAVRNTFGQLVLRSAISGSVVVTALLIAEFAGPAFGGMLALFPAVFTATMLITYFSQGSEFSAATMKIAMLSLANQILYALLVRFLYPVYDVWIGTFMAISITYLLAVGAYVVVKERIR